MVAGQVVGTGLRPGKADADSKEVRRFSQRRTAEIATPLKEADPCP